MAEGGPLLRRHTGKTRIEGSNPSDSANQTNSNSVILQYSDNEPSSQSVAAAICQPSAI